MTDFYLEPENVHRLYHAMCRCYCSYIDHAAKLFAPDAFFTSDDLGHQTGPMMSPEIFHDFLYPYYVRVGQTVRQHDMQFWLHSCGDNTLLFPDLISAGVDVFHPVQKHTMDEKRIAAEFGDRITILAGLDVQHTLQEKTPEGVREEVRFLIDTFDRPGGKMCLGAGNGIVSGTPFENIRAFLDEAYRYGREHRTKFG
jgi:uroporphyrinogen-III decarboxylase